MSNWLPKLVCYHCGHEPEQHTGLSAECPDGNISSGPSNKPASDSTTEGGRFLGIIKAAIAALDEKGEDVHRTGNKSQLPSDPGVSKIALRAYTTALNHALHSGTGYYKIGQSLIPEVVRIQNAVIPGPVQRDPQVLQERCVRAVHEDGIGQVEGCYRYCNGGIL
jgi:hypothetical protein